MGPDNLSGERPMPKLGTCGAVGDATRSRKKGRKDSTYDAVTIELGSG
jgi:hypothetical protein